MEVFLFRHVPVQLEQGDFDVAAPRGEHHQGTRSRSENATGPQLTAKEDGKKAKKVTLSVLGFMSFVSLKI